MPTFMFVGRREDKTTTIFFFSWILMQSFRIQLHKICQHLPTTWTKWNKRDKVWSRANLLFKLRSRTRRRRCCLSALLELNLGLKNSIRKENNDIRMACSSSLPSQPFLSRHATLLGGEERCVTSQKRQRGRLHVLWAHYISITDSFFHSLYAFEPCRKFFLKFLVLTTAEGLQGHRTHSHVNFSACYCRGICKGKIILGLAPVVLMNKCILLWWTNWSFTNLSDWYSHNYMIANSVT